MSSSSVFAIVRSVSRSVVRVLCRVLVHLNLESECIAIGRMTGGLCRKAKGASTAFSLE